MKAYFKASSCRTLLTAIALILSATLLNALDISGTVTVNGVPTGGVIVQAFACDKADLLGTTTTAADGSYAFTGLSASSARLVFTAEGKCSGQVDCKQFTPVVDFNLVCKEVPDACWMTGGGVKFERVTGTWNAQCSNQGGPDDSVGGNVYPSCSAFPGNGGNWNHVGHSLKLHLLGQDQTVIRCGNVPGIPPGTGSPVCSVNFIEWTGTGIVQGVNGGKTPKTDVSYFGRVEDRNEPGNEKALLPDGGAKVDRYFLRVVDGSGKVLILIDANGIDDDNGNGVFDEGDVDPLTITGGNFQIHCTSCD